MKMPPDKRFMKEALKEAEKALEVDEVPVGAVIVFKRQVIGRAHNQIKTLKDPTAHAEMIAVTQAASYLKNERLKGCDMYVTIEPCSMCVGALVLARVRKIVYAAKDPKTGACGSVFNLASSSKLNHRIRVRSGVMKDECAALIREFFKKKRKNVKS